MLDQDPAILENTYYDEIQIETIAPLTAVYDDMYAVAYEEYETERELNKANVEKPSLVLYTRSTCPFCKKVNKYLNGIHKSVPSRDIGQDPSAAKDLVKLGGKRQVPCLMINKKPLYESDAIIAWLKNNQDKY